MTVYAASNCLNNDVTSCFVVDLFSFVVVVVVVVVVVCWFVFVVFCFCCCDSFSLCIAASHMAHVLVYYTLLVVIVLCIMFVKLRKCCKAQWVWVHQRIALYKSYLLLLLLLLTYEHCKD